MTPPNREEVLIAIRVNREGHPEVRFDLNVLIEKRAAPATRPRPNHRDRSTRRRVHF